MADVVLNHVGYGDLSHGYNPFYKATYFHNCSLLASQNVGAVTSGNTKADVSVFVWDACTKNVLFITMQAATCLQVRVKASWLRGLVHAAAEASGKSQPNMRRHSQACAERKSLACPGARGVGHRLAGCLTGYSSACSMPNPNPSPTRPFQAEQAMGARA